MNTSTTLASTDIDGVASLGVAAAAAAIRNGELSSEAYATALLHRADAHSALNSFITIDQQGVLEAARAADRARAAGSTAPLLGVPLAVKDSYLTSGLRTTLGVGTLDSFIPKTNAEVVTAITDAGAILFGKNNLVEMSYGLTGANGAFGQVRNPNAVEHVTGGSSSGSAASVAAGIVPAAFGGDTVGSIRVPASLNGVVGFKPTTGRWPRGGVAPISHVLDTTGVFARSVEDIELLDEIICGHVPTNAFSSLDLRGVKLAYAPRHYLELVDPEVAVTFEAALARLRDAGADIVEVDLGDDFSELAEDLTWKIFFHDTRAAIEEFLSFHRLPTSFGAIYESLKGELKGSWEHFVLHDAPGNVSDEAYQAILSGSRPALKRRFQAAFANSGAQGLLFPTTPTTAPRIDEQSRFRIGDVEVSALALARNTVPASGAGLPGISIPIGWAENGLPIGLEIDGIDGHDRDLLALARRVENVVGRN